ncbi:chaperonin 10-like protein [Hyaloscypha finlandica]|nr:chaperonin 10-like protein [Hyaloscypha finlandica]
MWYNWTVTRPALTGHQVFVKTTHSGIGMGHEGAGVVAQVGPEATHHKIGDRVAWGWIYGSCGECASCQAGYIAMLFLHWSVWDSRFAYRNPDRMKSEDAALIICGGWTVWNNPIGYDLKPTDHVGVAGIGGLGNFAIQFANKMGCEVTAFSATESKKADSLALGAHHFVNTNLPVGERLKVARQINKLLVCTNAHIRWELLTRILVGKATMFPLQIPSDMASKLSVAHMPFPMKSINLLAFAALHNIKPVSGKFPLTGEGLRTHWTNWRRVQ